MTCNLRRSASLLGLATIAGAAHASFTVGTFADPVANSTQNYFRYTTLSPTTGFFEGEWLTDGIFFLTPGIPAPNFADVRFEMRDAFGNNGLDVTLDGNVFVTEAGYIRFFTAANETVLRVDFSYADLSGTGFTAGFGTTTPVTMSGSIVEPGWSNEHFAFAFSNWNQVGNQLTMSASFTSSAVPEPATLTLLGLGALAAARRRRR